MIDAITQALNYVSTYFIVIVIPIALFVEGIRRKIYARMQNRKGPPVMQPFYDIRKLLQKYKKIGKTLIFRIMPFAAIITAIVLFLFIPFSWIAFQYDFIVFVYLFILLDTFYLVGALSTESPFSAQACARDLLLMVGYEIVFMISAAAFLIGAGVTSISAYNAEFMFLSMPIASFILIYLGHVIVKVTPYDVVEAEPEISAGLFTEYLGKNLAVLEIAEFTKDLAFYMVAALFIFGRAHLIWGVLLLMLWYTVSKATTPRHSTFFSAKLFLFIALAAFINLVVLT